MTEQAIREAVEAGEYERASALFAAYARALPHEAQSVLQAGALVRWCEQTVICRRAHALARLQALRDGIAIAGAYRR